MSKLSTKKKTKTDNQTVIDEKKNKEIFNYLESGDKMEVCPVRDILSYVSDKWSILIVGFLGRNEKMRFNELKKAIHGVSSKVLSERLKRLERDGYVNRKVYMEVPVKVEYELTSLGISYVNQLLHMGEWIDKVILDILENRKAYDKKN